jgi:hypothetical protein
MSKFLRVIIVSALLFCYLQSYATTAGKFLCTYINGRLVSSTPSAFYTLCPPIYSGPALRAMESGTRGRVDPGSLALLISKRRAEGARAKSVKQLLPKA